MGTLVRTLSGDSIEADLRAAYVAVAHAYLEHRSGGVDAVDATDPSVLDAVVCATEEEIDLRAARENCQLLDTDFERPAEVFNQLGHMFVIHEALPLLTGLGLAPDVCAPTQQSADRNGVGVPDLGGSSWALEAFGGVDISNNGKLAKDMRALTRWPGRRTLLACRPEAWRAAARVPIGQAHPVGTSCGKKHGGPFRAAATAVNLAETTTVILVELTGITVTDG